jgi:hypothetical protein
MSADTRAAPGDTGRPDETPGTPGETPGTPGETFTTGLVLDPRRIDAARTDGVPVEVDLDQVTGPSVRQRHPFRGVLVALGVCGLLGGAALRATQQPPPAPQPLRVVATVGLNAVHLEPQPSADLEVHVTNRGDQRLVADTADVTGGGVATTEALLGIDLPPGGDQVATATVPLRCSPSADATVPVGVRITLRAAISGPALPDVEVAAVTTGPVADTAGLCAAADRTLPEGWRTPVRVVRSSLTAGRLTATVTDLPDGPLQVLAVQADGWLLPWSDAPPTVRDRTVELRLDPPSPECRDGGVRPVLPTGLQVMVASASGTYPVYAAIGADAAQWLADAFAGSCPSRPNGPPAVRTAFAG